MLFFCILGFVPMFLTRFRCTLITLAQCQETLQLMNTERQHMNRYIPPTIRVSFDHKIRKAWLTVDAEAWHDEDGIYKTAITNVWLDTAEVFDLLTSEDILDIETAIEPAIHAANDDHRVTGNIPSTIPTR